MKSSSILFTLCLIASGSSFVAYADDALPQEVQTALTTALRSQIKTNVEATWNAVPGVRSDQVRTGVAMTLQEINYPMLEATLVAEMRKSLSAAEIEKLRELVSTEVGRDAFTKIYLINSDVFMTATFEIVRAQTEAGKKLVAKKKASPLQ